jgi:hypothetical protein
MFIAWGAAAKESQDAIPDVCDLMIDPRGDGNRVTGTDFLSFVCHLHFSASFQDVIDLLGPHMVVALGTAAGGESRFCQRLVSDARIPVRQKFADFGTVFRNKCLDAIEVANIHGNDLSLIWGWREFALLERIDS